MEPFSRSGMEKVAFFVAIRKSQLKASWSPADAAKPLTWQIETKGIFLILQHSSEIKTNDL